MNLFTVIKNNTKLFRFAIVGISSTLVDVVVLYVCYDLLHIPLFISVILAFLLAVINGFIWNKIWTFGDTSLRYKRQFVKFLFVSTIGLLLTLFCMYIFVYIFSIHHIVAKLVTSVVVMSWNFLGNKYWTFKITSPDSSVGKTDFLYEYSIIIPAYNEEKRIVGTLKKIEAFMQKKSTNYEVLVVDDGSSDGTVKVVENLGFASVRIIRNEKNRGKGFTVKHGVENAQGRYILFTDADNSTPIEELDNLMQHIGTYDIVIGSRYCKDAQIKIQQTALRKKIGRVGNLIIQYFLLDGIEDTQCGFKLFQHHTAKRIFGLQKIHGFGFDMEILLAGKSLGYTIKEVPVEWYNSEFSRVRPVRDAFKTFLELLFIKINYWFDGYK